MLDILNLGGGVQSSTVFLMACRGLLPTPHYALFGNTRWEPPSVYRYLEFLKREGNKHGILTLWCEKGTSIREDAIKIMVHNDRSQGASFGSMPLYTLSADGKRGQIRRGCTDRYKIRPIETFIKTGILKLSRRALWPQEHCVRQWFGISSDEPQRLRAPVRRQRDAWTGELRETPLLWKSHYYPLMGIELFHDRRRRDRFRHWLSRQDCLEWLAKEGFPPPPRSSCVGCPYHSNEEWRKIREDPRLWQDAVEFDRQIRQPHGLDGQAFLHAGRIPLDQVDLVAAEEETQGCDSGHCFM